MAPTTVPDFSRETLTMFRKRAGWSRRELARRAGIAEPTLVKYENGQNRPSAAALQRLARALSITEERLRSGITPAAAAHDRDYLLEQRNKLIDAMPIWLGSHLRDIDYLLGWPPGLD